MVKQHYDVIFAGDFREPVARTTTIAEQLRAVTAAGYRTGLVQLSGKFDGRPSLIHDDIRQLIDSEHLSHLDPNQAFRTKLLIATDPALFIYRPRRILEIDAELRIVLASHGPVAATTDEAHDWARVRQHAADTLAGEVIWAPMNPTARERLAYLDPKPRLSDLNWLDCIDADEWHHEQFGFCSSRPVVGRSGRVLEEAWPESAAELLALFPDDQRYLVKILDAGPLLKNRLGSFPRNWDVLTSDQTSERDFFSSIDFFIYCHNTTPLNPIDPSLLRAMASGVVAIVSPSFEPIFSDSVVYAEPHEARSKIWDLYTNRARYLALRESGIQCIADNFSPKKVIGRISGLIGPPADHLGNDVAHHAGVCIETPRDRRRVMFITINGVGMGHLTRMLAIAKRCPSTIEPVFLTMSQALKVLREQGYLAEYIPSRQYLDCDLNHWNNFLRDEINELISFYDPAVVVFDGNVPYQGLIEAIKANPDPWFIWSRRGMWRSDNADIVGREKHFDAVLEPGDLAASDDYGITVRHQDRTYHVKPIRLLDSSEMLPRDEARMKLGLDHDKSAVLIQLGAGNNFDYRSIHKTALAHIRDRYDAQIAVGEWLISDQPIDLPETVVRMPGYPFARYFKAFDLAISAVGYNSFHELLYAGVPTILVPNEAMSQDNQLARALFADRQGLAICVRAKEIYRLTTKIDQLFQPEERQRIRSRLAALDPTNGAAEAALLVDELAYSRRVDRP